MKNFNDIGALWYDAAEYNAKNLNFMISKTGDTHGLGKKIIIGSTESFSEPVSVSEGCEETAKTVTAAYENGVEVKEVFEFFDTTDAIRQHNTVTNNGNESIKIDVLSSAVRISTDGILEWNDPNRFKIHYCISTWCGEAQWKSGCFEDFGMCRARASKVCSIERILLRSQGNWSTNSYYPMVIIEDMEKGRCYYFENECAHSWEIEISKPFDEIVVNINTANFDHDCWTVCLAPGESYTSTNAVYGMAEGGFEDAVAALNSYKRETNLAKWENGHAALVFNNYMGGTWGSPDERLTDLIDAAAEAGCEYFCIDAGWYLPGEEKNVFAVLGKYDCNDKRFAPYTFAQIIDRIISKGMKPGVWFELEAATPTADSYHIPGGLCMRNGSVLSGKRAFFDFTCKEVCDTMFNYVDAVYKLGVRYIKNDFNNSNGIGLGDRDYNENAKRMMYAFLNFIDELRRRYPDMIIENCGSGGMRSDNMTLSHHHIQSTSDQECFFKNPSIIMGSCANMPPEKAGAWSYPIYEDYGPEEFDNPDQEAVKNMLTERYADGETTIFCMVNGNMGAMYMSGRIDWADGLNKALIHEGTALYKSNRDFIAKAHPIYPTGLTGAGQKGIATMGHTDGSRIILAVWKIEESHSEFVIDLSRYTDKNSELKMIYPAADTKCKYNFVPSTGRLTLRLDGCNNMARLFEIKI